MTASGNVVLVRELAKCAEKIADVSIITGVDVEKKRYRGIASGSLTCYRGLLRALSKNIEIVHLIDVPICSVPLFYRKTKKHGSRLIYHVWSLPEMRTKLRFYASILQRFTDAIVCTSPRILKTLKYYIDDEKLWLIPPPINDETYKPITHAKSSIDEPLILYIGSLHPARFPVVEVLKAFKKIHEEGLRVTLTVVGAPRYKFDSIVISNLRKLSEEVNLERYLNITLRRISLDEKIRLYNSADVVLFPYKSSVEDVVDPPITLLEAMSCSRIVVSTKVLSIPWIIKDGLNGVLCNGLSYLHIHDALMNALSVSDKYILQRNARKTIVECFSYRAISKLLYNLWNELCA
jgi:glycosyltransferase involved in cell wall biosynthesis